MPSTSRDMDDLISSFSTCMNENFQMDDMMSAVSRIKTRGSSSSTSTSVAHTAPAVSIPEFDDSEWGFGEWTAVVVDEDDLDWRKDKEPDEFADYTPAQQKVLKQARSTLKRLEAVCFEAGKAWGWYDVILDEITSFSSSLGETHDAWSHIYDISLHHLEPERPAAQALQLAIRRLGDLEKWCRTVGPWVLDTRQKLDPFHNRLKGIVAAHRLEMQALQERYAEGGGTENSHNIQILWCDGASVDIEKELQFPKVPRIPAPCGAHGSEYLDWPQEERWLVEKALDILETAVWGAQLWKMF